MKKLALVLAAAGALAVPAEAAGPPAPEYGGEIDKKSDRYFGFDVKGSGGDRKIKNAFAINIPFSGCDDEMQNGEQSGPLEKSVDVKANGSFNETHTYKPAIMPRRGGPPKISYTLKGELDGNKATGTIRIQFKRDGCDTGSRPFKAKSPAPKPPVPTRP